MDTRADSGLEIRRILLLTRLKDAPKGMSLPQIVKDCSKVSGWNVSGRSGEEVAHEVLQSLVDDKLVALGTRFGATIKGLEYLEDPLQWRIDDRTTEELADRMFWKEVYDVFDKAYHKLRSKT